MQSMKGSGNGWRRMIVSLLIVVLMDFFLVALVINKSMEMFQSPLGTWMPFGLIFLSTFLTGLIVEAKVK